MNSEQTKMQRKFCSAILAKKDTQPYKKYVQYAEKSVCAGIQDKKTRDDVIRAIELNLINYKLYPFGALQRKYGLPISVKYFAKEKKAFCDAITQISRTGEEKNDDCGTAWTKEGVLNMLYNIADEANEYIVRDDGAFNHQVAGIALKAIDQAVKLCGLCERSETESAVIELDEATDSLGA